MNELISVEYKEQKPNDLELAKMSNYPKKPNARFSIYFSLIIAASLIFLAISCSVCYPTDPSGGFAEQLGESIGETSVWGIIFLLLGWRSISRHKKEIVLALIFCAITSYNSVNLLNKASDAKKAMRQIASVFNDLIADRQIPNSEKDNKSYGEMTPLVNILSNWTKEAQKSRWAMSNELDKCNLECVLNPKTLTQSNLLSECQSNYEKADDILQKYDKEIRQQLSNFSTEIKNSNLSENLKTAVLSGFNKKKDEALKNILDIFEVRSAYISEAKNLLAFMKDKQTTYYFQNNRILFKSQEDADVFNSYVERLMSLSKQEASWGENVQHKVTTQAKELEGLVK